MTVLHRAWLGRYRDSQVCCDSTTKRIALRHIHTHTLCVSTAHRPTWQNQVHSRYRSYGECGRLQLISLCSCVARSSTFPVQIVLRVWPFPFDVTVPRNDAVEKPERTQVQTPPKLPPYAMSVPQNSVYHTLCQYRAPRGKPPQYHATSRLEALTWIFELVLIPPSCVEGGKSAAEEEEEDAGAW